VKYIPSSENIVANTLSRKLPGPIDLEELAIEEDLDNFVDRYLFLAKAEEVLYSE
jgi:hypothetical protein